MSGKQPLVSIVILNFNGKEFLDGCLGSVLDTDYSNFEVIFVDNASTDGSLEYAKERFGKNPHLKIIQNTENLGFDEGSNVGVRAASGAYIVFLNNDTEVNPQWLKELVQLMESDLGIGACQSKLLLLEDSTRFDCTGGLLDYFGFPYGKGDFQKDAGQYDRVEEIFHAKGAAMTVRRKVLEEVGLFDPKFIFYYEEVDLCWRIHLSGYKVVFVPKSVVLHAGEKSTAKQPSPVKTFHATKNHLLILLKNYGRKKLFEYVPIIIFLRLTEVLFLILKRQPELSLAKIRAFIWILMNFKYIWQERMRVQRFIRRVPDKEIMKVMEKPYFPRLYSHLSQLYVT